LPLIILTIRAPSWLYVVYASQEEILAVSALILIAISLTATAGDVKAATSPLALFQ
jgi:hypothetical protein